MYEHICIYTYIYMYVYVYIYLYMYTHILHTYNMTRGANDH